MVFAIAFSTAVSALELTIKEAISRGVDRSYSIKSSIQDSLAARFEYLSARTAFWPVLSLNATGFYSNPIQTIHTPWTEIGLGQKENYLADLKISLPLYAGGRLSNRLKMQRALLDMSGLDLEAKRLDIARAIRTLSLQFLIAEASLASAEASLARLNLLAEDVRNRFDNGLADSIDLLESALSLSSARRSVLDKSTALTAARIALATHLDLPETEKIVFVDSIPPPKNPAENPESYPMQVDNRPELKAALSKITVSELTEKLTRGNLLPGLTAFVGYSYGKPNRDLTGDSWNESYMSGLTLHWEFNLGAGDIKNFQAAKSRTESSSLAKEDIAESFSTAARIACLELQNSYDQFLLSKTEFSIAENKYRLALEKQKAGSLALNRVLESEKELAASEQQYRQAILYYYLKETEYFYSVGSSKIYGGLN